MNDPTLPSLSQHDWSCRGDLEAHLEEEDIQRWGLRFLEREEQISSALSARKSTRLVDRDGRAVGRVLKIWPGMSSMESLVNDMGDLSKEVVVTGICHPGWFAAMGLGDFLKAAPKMAWADLGGVKAQSARGPGRLTCALRTDEPYVELGVNP
jgi:hypothetical protein